MNKIKRYFKRKKYLLGCGWYRNIKGDFVSSHGEMVVPFFDIIIMDEINFKKICPYFN